MVSDVIPDGAVASVGFVLKDMDEATIVDALWQSLNAIHDELGEAGYQSYERDQRWAAVMAAAEHVASAITDA